MNLSLGSEDDPDVGKAFKLMVGDNLRLNHLLYLKVDGSQEPNYVPSAGNKSWAFRGVDSGAPVAVRLPRKLHVDRYV